MLTYIYFEVKVWVTLSHYLKIMHSCIKYCWTMKYRSHRPTFIFRSNIRSYWPIIPKYDVQTSNSLQDVTQNHWTMKYRSQWPTFILRSNFGSYWFIIPNKDVHTSNNLQDIRPNHRTMKYRSQWPTFILRSNVRSYWFILLKHDVHTSNSLQAIRQNHWTVKYRSCWPSLHDPQQVTRLSHVRPTICKGCFHNRKSRKTLFKGVLDFDLLTHPGAWTLGSGIMEWKPTLQGTYGPNRNAFWWVVGEIYPARVALM